MNNNKKISYQSISQYLEAHFLNRIYTFNKFPYYFEMSPTASNLIKIFNYIKASYPN